MSEEKRIEAVAKVLAAYELFDWSTLPESSAMLLRDRAAFRLIATSVLTALQGAP